MTLTLQETTKRQAMFKAFLIALITSFAFFLPFIIYDHGYFLFVGDFNVQQIPFYSLAHDAVKSGNIFWSFTTDLGANFIGSYSFYLLFSPFFWLTLPFPNWMVPYLMAPLLMLKFAVSAMTAAAFIGRFCKNQNYAVLGGLLYAFSGFSVYNIFFNHFNDVIAFFPLMLIALEELMVNNRRGYFGFMVAFMAALNYFFFVGQVVFVILYFVVRTLSGDWKMTIKKFLWLCFESVLGVLLAAGALLPSVMAILDNPRTSSSLTGWNMLLYNNVQRYFAIIQSFFFPPELPYQPNFFPDYNAKWSSMAGFLPLISMSGVIAYLQSKKQSWLKRIIWICTGFALVPVLNSLFFALNSSYYARWFYMPILMMALATVISLEDHKIDLYRGMKWTLFITLGFMCIGIIPNVVDGEITLGLEGQPFKFWVNSAIALISLAGTFLIVSYFRNKNRKDQKIFIRALTVGVCVITVAYSCFYIGTGKSHSEYNQWIINTGINGRQNIDLNDNEFFRVDVFEGLDNQAMFWKMPTIQTFHSIVPASIMEFYPQVGVTRDVGSRPSADLYALRSLLSVKYLFSQDEKETQPAMPGFSYYTNQNGFNIYKNDNFIPMGFTYDYYLTQSMFDSTTTSLRGNLLLKGMLLSDMQILKHSDILKMYPDIEYPDYSDEALANDCANRRAESSYYFAYDNYGFTSKINLSTENLVFFSVPWDEGWSATIDGEPVEIEKVNVGFMAVRVPEGDHEIRFNYQTPGLKTGLIITGGALLIFIPYTVLYFIHNRKKKKIAITQQLLTSPMEDDFDDIWNDEQIEGQVDLESVLNGEITQEPLKEEPLNDTQQPNQHNEPDGR